MSILKEMIKAATGIEIEVHNVIVDFRTPDGKSAHRAHQVVSSGAPCTDEAITERIKADLPRGCRLCSIYELMVDCEVSELERLAMSLDVMQYKPRFIYVDRELAAEYIKEIRNGNLG
ncbi:hypothetical protein AALC75_12565 [Lachnospiraceae bacterium 48-42]